MNANFHFGTLKCSLIKYYVFSLFYLCRSLLEQQTELVLIAYEDLSTGMRQNKAGFIPGIFLGGAKMYCYASIFCYANFSIVFGPNFKGEAKVSEGDKLPLPQGAPPATALYLMLYSVTVVDSCRIFFENRV